MILGEATATVDPGNEPKTTLDALFRRALARRPDAIALADPPNRASFTSGEPRRLTYTEADRIVSAIAVRLRALNLPADSVVGIQLPNIVENALTILGVLRAGLIAAPLPLLWRRADLVPALSRLGAKAIVAAGRADGLTPCADAMQAAAELFPVRYICGFGADLPDGVIPCDELLTVAPGDFPEVDRGGDPSAHVAIVTVEITATGPLMVARSHKQLVAGGLGALLEGGVPQDARLLAACAMGSFAGVALSLVPWLLSGGTLSLHHGFDAQAFAAQCRDDRCDTVVVPAPLLSRFADAGQFSHPELKNVLALWRAPERFGNAPRWPMSEIALTDMLAFGEIALLGSRRGGSGEAALLPADALVAPRAAADGMPIAEFARTPVGTLAVRGPMVPRHAFPAGVERGDTPCLTADAAGFVDTRYACRFEAAARTLAVTAPPPGLVAVGGYRFALGDLDRLAYQEDGGALVTALPDSLAGHRLAGICGDASRMRQVLAEGGASPLLIGAFEHDGAAPTP